MLKVCSYRLPHISCLFLTACRQEAEVKRPLPLNGPDRLEGAAALSNRLAARRNYNHP